MYRHALLFQRRALGTVPFKHSKVTKKVERRGEGGTVTSRPRLLPDCVVRHAVSLCSLPVLGHSLIYFGLISSDNFMTCGASANLNGPEFRPGALQIAGRTCGRTRKMAPRRIELYMVSPGISGVTATMPIGPTLRNAKAHSP